MVIEKVDKTIETLCERIQKEAEILDSQFSKCCSKLIFIGVIKSHNCNPPFICTRVCQHPVYIE